VYGSEYPNYRQSACKYQANAKTGIAVSRVLLTKNTAAKRLRVFFALE
jgi:hypothetical protein